MGNAFEPTPEQEVLVRFNGYWYPGVVIRTTPKKVGARFWTCNGKRERVKMVPRDYVLPKGSTSERIGRAR